MNHNYQGISMNKIAALLLVLVFLSASCTIIAKPALSSDEMTENSWTTKTPMLTARSCLGVATVNGRIYAIGGFPDYSTNEEYDPATGKWTTKASMPTGRYNFGIAVYNNRIYCIGGQFNANKENPYAGPEYTGAVEVYNPASNTWETEIPMPHPRTQLQAKVVNGKIYLIGGRTGSMGTTVTLNEVYDPDTETWTTKSSMIYPVACYSSAVIDNKIYLFGGQSETKNLAVNQIYDVETDTWGLGAPLPTTVWRSAAAATTGVLAPQRIYVIGGQPDRSSGATDSTQVYNPENDSWSTGASMPTARFDLAVAMVNETLYAIGGTEHYLLLGEEANSGNELYIPIGYGSVHGTPTFNDDVTQDNVPPELLVLSPENKTYDTNMLQLTFTVNESGSWIRYKLDESTVVEVDGNTTINGLSSGSHNLTVYATDDAGNTNASQTIHFTIMMGEQESFPTALVIAASGVSIVIVGIGLLVYFKKRKH
jgi:N-acetylneuraminic acid mutarotase